MSVSRCTAIAAVMTVVSMMLFAVVDGFAFPMCQSTRRTLSFSAFTDLHRHRHRRLFVSVEDDIMDGSSFDGYEEDPSSGDVMSNNNNRNSLDPKRYSMTKINNVQVLTTNSNNNNNKKKTRPVTFFDEEQENNIRKRRRSGRRQPNRGDDDQSDENNDMLAMLESQQKELSSSLGALKQSLNEEQTRSQSLQERLERAEQIIAEQREELRRATEEQERQVQALEARLGRAQEELEVRLEREQALEDQKSQLLGEVQQEGLEQQVESLQTELDKATEDSEQSKKEVDAVSTELSVARSQISSLIDKLRSAQNKGESYQGKTKNLETKLDVARQKLAVKQQALTKTQRELAQAQSMLDLQDKLRGKENRGGTAKNTLSKPSSDSASGPKLFPGNFLGGAAAAAAAQAAAKPMNSIRKTPPRPVTASKAKVTTTTQKKLEYPVIQNWSINDVTGEVTGIVRNHPQIEDGTKIVTSSLANTRLARANAVVVTKSGSRYQLATPQKKLDTKQRQPLPKTLSTPMLLNKSPPRPQQQQQQQSSAAPSESRDSVSSGVKEEDQQLKKTPFNIFSGISNLPSVKKEEEEEDASFPQLQFPLTGEAIGGGKYLLAGRPKRKPSGRSEIVTAYVADENRNPTGNPVAIKFSTHKEKMRSEYSNYLKVQQKGFLFGSDDQHSPFVRWLDYMDQSEGSVKYAQHTAMVMELGVEDLREYRSRKGSMNEDEIKAALHTAARCIDALHNAKLIWTDLKAENFVRMDTGDDGNVVFKGIDLESAIPLRGNPLDYTPEASPPEFAQAYLAGEAYDFVLDYSYDVWSFGMLAYELVHGNGFFGKKAPPQIVKALALDFRPPKLDNFEDEKLRDLVERCLALDPKRRPSASWILNHPYFRGLDNGGGMPRLFGW